MPLSFKLNPKLSQEVWADTFLPSNGGIHGGEADTSKWQNTKDFSKSRRPLGEIQPRGFSSLKAVKNTGSIDATGSSVPVTMKAKEPMYGDNWVPRAKILRVGVRVRASAHFHNWLDNNWTDNKETCRLRAVESHYTAHTRIPPLTPLSDRSSRIHKGNTVSEGNRFITDIDL